MIPENWAWAEGEIHECLKKAHCCVACMTSAVYDAVLAGCVAISVQRELGLMSNYFDILEEEFPILHAVTPDKLWERLDALLGQEREVFRQEFTLVRQRLIKGLSQPTYETLSVFTT